MVKGKLVHYRRFKTTLAEAPDEEVASKWSKEFGVHLEFKEISNEWWNYIFNLLPWILFGVFWIFILRRMQGGGAKGIFSFGKSRAKMLTENQTRVTFDDVAGAEEAKQELREIIDFLKDPEKFQKLGGKIPKGALLLGPPGTGKTLLAKAVAGEAGVPFFSMSGADFVEMFVGVGASRVRDLFEQGKKNAPCIIFIDEVDAVGRHRGAGLGGGHDEREQTLNQLLVEMDGFDSNEGVILIAATNRPDVLDHALLRPGRFDRQIVVDRPDVRGREGILKVHTRNIPIARDVDLSIIAKGTPGFSGADLANLVNEAALLAARQNKKMVEMSDFESAKDKVMMGTERKSMLINDEEKKVTAYHEAGHVLVAMNMPKSDPVHKVTIIPRGRALGLTTILPMDEKHNYSKTYYESMLCTLLGGRAAEKLVLNELTVGAGNDLERATEIARKMVCEWGMSEKLGPLTFGKKDEEIFLGREIARHRDYSEKTAQVIDEEVTAIVTTAARKAEEILEKNLPQLHALSAALLEKEILDGEEIRRIVNGSPKELLESKNNSKKKATSKGEATKKQAVTD
ncbi:MAG: ATP-dependent zinc metalloprotease FtsH [Calditrichaeota bacterium]|nr:MAG: ATP-dependent zinc metalloprotease FtsH [Calditrichota bacterium]